MLKEDLLDGLHQNQFQVIILNEIQKLNKNQISKPIKINNNIVIIKLNDKRTLNQNKLNLAKIEKNIINKKKEEKLNIF